MTSVSLVVVVGEDAAFEGDREGVECGLPAVHPALAALSGGVEAADNKVEAFQGGLLVGEVASGSGGTAEAGVQAFDRVRRVDHPSDFGAVVQERRELGPGVVPQ